MNPACPNAWLTEQQQRVHATQQNVRKALTELIDVLTILDQQLRADPNRLMNPQSVQGKTDRVFRLAVEAVKQQHTLERIAQRGR